VVTFPILGRHLRRRPGLRRLGTGLILAGPLTLALAVWYLTTFTPTVQGASHGIAGLTEPLLVIEILVWCPLLGLAARGRRTTTAPTPEPQPTDPH
jgi:hypothetical protein